MGCLKLEYQPQERVLEENTLFLEKGLEKKGSAIKNRVRRYRYGFNGMERDNEVKGSGNSLDFGARIYDSRLGKWLSADPSEARYPGWSTYNFVQNNPIIYNDPDGKDARVTITKQENGTTVIKISSTLRVKEGVSQATIDAMQTNLNRFVNQSHELEKGGKNYVVQFDVTVATGVLQKGDNSIDIVPGRPQAHGGSGEFIDVDTKSDMGTMVLEIGNEITVDDRQSKEGNTISHEFLHLTGLADRYYDTGNNLKYSVSDNDYREDIMGASGNVTILTNTDQLHGLIDAIETKTGIVELGQTKSTILQLGDKVPNYNVRNVSKKQTTVHTRTVIPLEDE
jgi:RHS repeat-associated protein